MNAPPKRPPCAKLFKFGEFRNLVAWPQGRGREQDVGQTSQQLELHHAPATIEAAQDKNKEFEQTHRQIDKNDEYQNIGNHFTAPRLK